MGGSGQVLARCPVSLTGDRAVSRRSQPAGQDLGQGQRAGVGVRLQWAVGGEGGAELPLGSPGAVWWVGGQFG